MNKTEIDLKNDETTMTVHQLNVDCIASSNGNFEIDSNGHLKVQSFETMMKQEINELDLLDRIYPIGSIYFSVNNENPGLFFGGVWETFAKGRTLIGIDLDQPEFASLEKIGGNKNTERHTHVIYDGELYKRSGNPIFPIPSPYAPAGGAGYGWYRGGSDINSYGGYFENTYFGTGDTGNLQPYITCSIWKRVS